MQESLKRTAGPEVKAHSKGIEVYVEQHVKEKMEGWCNAAHSEVSGWFLVKKQGAIFHAYDVFLPEQMGSSGYTKINGHATGRLYGYLQKKYGFEGMGDLKGWWHTHYTGAVFWSGTDDDQAQANAELAEDWSLSIVINQSGHWLARVDVVDPIPVMVDKLPIVFVPNTTEKHAKRDYLRDVTRWVSPFPSERTVFIDRKSVSDTKYINYGGILIPMDTIRKIVDCPCGDMTCAICLDMIKQTKKSVENDIITEEQELAALMANGGIDT